MIKSNLIQSHYHNSHFTIQITRYDVVAMCHVNIFQFILIQNDFIQFLISSTLYLKVIIREFRFTNPVTLCDTIFYQPVFLHLFTTSVTRLRLSVAFV